MKRFRSRALWLAFAWLGGAGCDSSSPGPEESPRPVVRIAAASDLKFALDEIVLAYRAREGAAEIAVTYGSSGSFFAQLSNKAPYDLFLSADVQYPRTLVEQGHGVPESQFVYAIGRIVVWVRKESTLDLEKLGILAVADPSVRTVAIADPKVAPFGRAAEAALKSAGVYESVKDRLILAENIAQTAQFVESGAADVGILSLSLALSPPMKGGRFREIPVEAYPKIEQGGVILKWAADPRAAEAFRRFLLEPETRALFKSHGFTLPDG